jgi:tetratricopeptide (TPR) repeat protein
MTVDPAYNCRELMNMKWLAALCIVLALKSGVDALAMSRSTQRRQPSQRTASKTDLQTRLSVAARYREQGEFDRAAQEYLKLIQLAPRFAPAYNELGVCYLRQGKLADAARALERAAQLAPTVAGVHLNLGIAYFRLERYDKAQAALERARKQEPGNGQALHLLGLSYVALKQYREAIPPLHQALESTPGDISIQYNLATAYANQGELEKAESILADLIRNHPDSAAVHLLLGDAYAGRSDAFDNITKAIEEYKLSVELDPQLPLAHFKLGQAYLKLSRLDEAAACFKKELFLATVYLAQQKPDDAIGRLDELLKLNPRDTDALYNLGRAYLQKEELVKAVEALKRSVALNPERSEAHYQLGRAYMKIGQDEQGRRELKIAQQLQQNQVELERQKLEKESHKRTKQ